MQLYTPPPSVSFWILVLFYFISSYTLSYTFSFCEKQNHKMIAYFMQVWQEIKRKSMLLGLFAYRRYKLLLYVTEKRIHILR